MILVLINAHLKPRAALLYPGRCFAAVSLDQTSNIADAPSFRNHPRLSENPRGQLRNWRGPLCNFPSNTFVASESPDRQMIGSCKRHVLSLCGQGYIKCEREGSSSQRRGITKGQAVTHTPSDANKIQKGSSASIAHLQ
jgi:hypothetical protein